MRMKHSPYEALLVKRVRSIAHKFAKEHVFVAVQAVDDHVKEASDLMC